MFSYDANPRVSRAGGNLKHEGAVRTPKTRDRAAPYTKERKHRSKSKKSKADPPLDIQLGTPTSVQLENEFKEIKAQNPKGIFPNQFFACDVEIALPTIRTLFVEHGRKGEKMLAYTLKNVFKQPPAVNHREWLSVMHHPGAPDLFDQFADKGRVEDATFEKFAAAAKLLPRPPTAIPTQYNASNWSTSAVSDTSSSDYVASLPQPQYAQSTTFQAPINSMVNTSTMVPSCNVQYTHNIGHSQQVPYGRVNTVETAPAQTFIPPQYDHDFYAPSTSYPSYGCTSPVSDASEPSPYLAYQQVPSVAAPPVGTWMRQGDSHFAFEEEMLSDYISDQVLVNGQRGDTKVAMPQQQVVHDSPYQYVPVPLNSISGASNQAGTSTLPESANGLWETEAFSLDSLSAQVFNDEFENAFFNDPLPSYDPSGLPPFDYGFDPLEEFSIDFGSIAHLHPADLQGWP